MYFPSFKEFKDLSKKGNLIPVYKEILADLETPVSAFLKIDSSDYSFLLESVEGGEKWGRYCFLGTDPSIVIESKGTKIKITSKDKTVKKTSAKGPIGALRDIMSQYTPVNVEGLPRFSGGAVGFLGYDVVTFFENLPSTTEDDLQIPDSIFIITDTLLIFDNTKKTIKVLANVHLQGDDLLLAYNDAILKIDNLIAKLTTHLPLPQREKGNKKQGDPLNFTSSFQKEQYKKSVECCKKYIEEGDIFQVVLAHRLKLSIESNPFDIYRSLRILNPSPYMYYLSLGKLKIIGSSPEVMVRLEDNKVEVRPIAGTRPRGKNEAEDKILSEELLSDPKECAEHIMLVDLARNDAGRVSELGSIRVSQLMVIEKYSHVIHIVSNVSGTLRDGMDCFDVISATFPAGTVSGSPKIRAMEIIDELEPTRRGIYAGAVGYFGFSGNMDTAISIRTLLVKDNIGYLGVGAGIVADSVPEKEYEETLNKGAALLTAIKMAKTII